MYFHMYKHIKLSKYMYLHTNNIILCIACTKQVKIANYTYAVASMQRVLISIHTKMLNYTFTLNGTTYQFSLSISSIV